MKVVSWNINSVRARLKILLCYLKQHSPDVVLLQETKCIDDVFPTSYIEDEGYNVVVRGQKSYNGVAILSKYPIELIDSNLCEDEARYLEVCIKGKNIICVYVPQGESIKNEKKYKKKITFMDKLLKYIQKKDVKNLLIGGDFNICMYDCDTHNAEYYRGDVPCTHLERKYMFSLLKCNMKDVMCQYTDVCESKNKFTWWNYRFRAWEKNMGLRLDYILASLDVEITSWGVDICMRNKESEDIPSDHIPVWIKIKD